MMAQSRPRLHNEIYPFISPSKFAGSLKDKITVITGSVGTIGQSIAECFAVAGGNLVLVYNRTEPTPDAETRLLELGASKVTFMKCNVSDLCSCEDLVEKIEKKVGLVDILINNAGVDTLGIVSTANVPDLAKTFTLRDQLQTHTKDPRHFISALAINLNGPYFLTQLLLSTFVERRSGCVINIASRSGSIDSPFNTGYSVSKAALIRLTGCLQKELDALGYNDIHIYAIHPGAVRSALASSEGAKLAFPDHPQIARGFTDILQGFKDTPHLSGMTSVALATGIAKDVLKGKYFDVQHDLGDVLMQASAITANPSLYTLGVSFPGGLPNDGGTELLNAEVPYDFPSL